MTSNMKKPLAVAIGATFLASMALPAVAGSNPFTANPLSSGYDLVSKAQEEGKCGEGKCGEGKKDDKNMEASTDNMKKCKAEGKCGEGKCGDKNICDVEKAKPEAAQPKSDAVKTPDKSADEGKCGEGMCGGM